MQQVYDCMIWNSFNAGSSSRKSNDKIINTKGKRFMEFCNDYGVMVLNGVTRGDEEGNFTFVGGAGQSVNDICAVSQDIVKYVDNFSVGDNIWSDHFSIHLTLTIDMDTQGKETLKMLPKLKWIEGKKTDYQQKIQQRLVIMKQEKNEINLKDITDIIRVASGSFAQNTVKSPNFKDKWFDNDCMIARAESFEMLKQFRENPGDAQKISYLRANRRYKDICAEKKVQYFTNLELKVCLVKNNKEWWNIVKEIRQETFNVSPDISSNNFKMYFENLLNPPQISNNISYAALWKDDPDLDAAVTVEEVRRALAKAKCNKAPGKDRVSYEFFKNAPLVLIQELTLAYNRALDSGCADESFLTSVIFPIYKKGENNIPSNYRGISFMNCIAKIIMGVINERLFAWVEKHRILSEYQAGFRKHYSTIDNIYNLSAIVQLKFHQKRKVYAFFVDFKAAFDKVSRSLLFYKLHEMGISTKMVYFLESVYKITKSVVWTGKEMSEEFETKSGVKQGCLLSPLLFALYINDLHEILSGGLYIDEKNIRLLLYADDIVILADNVNVLQNMIKRLENYCQNWNLEVNLNKSEIMVFRNGGRRARDEKWTFNGNEIKIVSSFCYLGMTLTPKMIFKQHIENRNNTAKNSINATWNSFLSKKNISLRAKWQLFQAACRAVQTYGAQVWGHSLFDEVDKLQRYFVKKILCLPSFTPTYILMLETNMEDGHLYTLDLHLRYVGRTLFELGANRLPHQLSLKLIEKKLSWVNNLHELCRQLNIGLEYENMSEIYWNFKTSQILEKLRIENKKRYCQSALETNRFYKNLDFSIGRHYMIDENTQTNIMWVFKARSDLIELNATRFTVNRSNICSLCNLNEDESIQHFIGRCPILREFRLRYLGNIFLENNAIIEILNGKHKGWSNLVNYIINALKYRQLLIDEYNY